MGLLGLFFNKSLLKIILVVVAIFLLLQAIEGFASFVAQFGTIQLTALALIALATLAGLSARSERLKFLSGPTKFLGFAAVPSLLLFEAVTLVWPPSSLAGITALAVPALPYILYFACRGRIFSWSNPASHQDIKKRYNRLTKGSLTPKGIEEGHIVFSAGRRGFRTLRLIEIINQDFETAGRHAVFEETYRRTVKTLSTMVAVANKLRVEFSYELQWQDDIPHITVATISEGRDYRRCRSLVDEFTRILVQHMRLNHANTRSVTQVADSSKAEKLLLMSLFLDTANLQNIEINDRSVVLTSNGNPARRTRLRMMHVSDLTRTWESTGVSLLDEFVRIAMAYNHTRNLVCTVHVKPFPNSYLRKETAKLEESYHSAMARIIEDVNSEVHAGKGIATSLLIGHDKDNADATSSANDAKKGLQRLRDAENSGFFGVSMALIGDPAAVESIARQLKSRLSSLFPDIELHIDRLPPIAFHAAIRRDPLVFSGKLAGNELTILLTPPEFTHELKTNRISPTAANAFDSSAVEKSISE